MLCSGNDITAPAAALLVHYIAAHEQLKEFQIDGEYLITFEISIVDTVFSVSPAQVSECPEWSQLKLPPVSAEILRGGWKATLPFVRDFLRGDNVPVFDMRLMVVGASEVRPIA